MSRSSLSAKPLPRLHITGILILCAFIISGACGLIHEVAWTRLLRLVMGNTTYSITTVLTAFMGGLALGSYLGGRIIDRRHDPLRIFAILEGNIAIYCFLLPFLIQGTEPIYSFLYQNTHTNFYIFSIIRFLFSALLLLIPATFMGATLPVLTRFFTQSSDSFGFSVGRLYALNTFGAVLGASTSGFFLLPSLGVTRTIYLACFLNLLVGVTSYLIYLRTQGKSGFISSPVYRKEVNQPLPDKHTTNAKTAGTAESSSSYGKGMLRVLLICYGFSGFSALVYEIAWTRSISLLIGSTVYAFSMMLTAFVLGLALGSMACSRFADRIKAPMRSLAVIQAGIGLSALLVVPLIGNLPFFVTRTISKFIESFWMLQIAEFGIVLLIMLVPTFLMGAAFPIANKLYNQSSQQIGRSVGTVYGSNTVGTIIGAFTGGFILIPIIGIQNSIFLAVFINIAAGLIFFGMSRELVLRFKIFSAAIIVIVSLTVFAIIPAWDISLMSFGPFHEAARISDNTAQSQTALKSLAQNSKVIFHKEGLTTTVTVKQVTDNIRTLYINGKPDASSFSDLPTQMMVAHIPLLMHQDPKNALVIGLASGISLGSAGLHSLKEIDCVEISPVMLEACRYFDEYNYSILDDPRVNTIIADGRNHLALTEKSYDVIISQPSNPYFAGIADLFTLEFFELCNRRLTYQGVMCTWVQSYNIDMETFQSIVHTFHSVFPNMTLWRVGKSDCILVGSKQEFNVDYSLMNTQMNSQKIARDLKRIGVQILPEIFSQYVMGPEGIQTFINKAGIHTDDNALVEFSAPRALTRNAYDWTLINAIEESRDSNLSFLRASEGSMTNASAQIEKAKNYAQARGHVFKGHIHINENNEKLAAEELSMAASLNPRDKMLREFNAPKHKQAFYLAKKGLEDQAIALYRNMLEILPIDEKAHYNLATVFKKQGNFPAALSHYREAANLKPDYINALYNVGEISERLKDNTEAVRSYQTVLNIKPDMIPALNNLAILLASDKVPAFRNISEAIHLAERACEITNYQDSYLLNTLSITYASGGRFKEAVNLGKKALQLARDNGNHQLVGSIKRHLKHVSDLVSEQ